MRAQKLNKAQTKQANTTEVQYFWGHQQVDPTLSYPLSSLQPFLTNCTNFYFLHIPLGEILMPSRKSTFSAVGICHHLISPAPDPATVRVYRTPVPGRQMTAYNRVVPNRWRGRSDDNAPANVQLSIDHRASRGSSVVAPAASNKNIPYNFDNP